MAVRFIELVPARHYDRQRAARLQRALAYYKIFLTSAVLDAVDAEMHARPTLEISYSVYGPRYEVADTREPAEPTISIEPEFPRIPVQSIGGASLEIQLGKPCGGGPANHYSLLADGRYVNSVRFQSQDPKLGINGFTNEALLAVVRDRLEGFQRGPVPNKFNVRALAAIDQALEAMNERVADRDARGVRGLQIV